MKTEVQTKAIIADAIDAFANNVPSADEPPPQRDESTQRLMERLVRAVTGREVTLEDVVEFKGRWQVRFEDAVFQLRVPDNAWGIPELELLSFRCAVCVWAYPVALESSLADVGRVMARHLQVHGQQGHVIQEVLV